METQTLIGIIFGGASILGALIGVYVNLSNEIKIHNVRIEALERRVDQHDEKLERKFDELLRGMHKLELLIENLRTHEK